MALNDDDSRMPRVVAIVPVFNRLTSTRDCLKGLKAQTIPDLEIVVVDGGSSDGTPAVLQRDFPDIRLYADEGDLWWTDAVALGVEREILHLTSNDYIFLVNNDTVLNEDSICRLVTTSRKHSDAIVAASVKEMSGRGIVAGSRMTWGVHLGEPLGHLTTDIDNNETIEVDVVFGRATLIPVHVFHRIGNFDAKSFPQYFGDSDFFLRASRSGIRVLIDCRTIVHCHEDESNTGVHFVQNRAIPLRRVWQMASSKKSNLNLLIAWRFAWRHAPGWQKPLSASALLFRNMATILNLYLHNFPWLLSCVAMIFGKINQFTRMRPRYLTFSELRHLGFDPLELRRNLEILPSGIPHTYDLHVPRLRMLAERERFMPLILRNYDPCVKLRVRRFIKAWRSSKRGKAIISREASLNNNRSGKNTYV